MSAIKCGVIAIGTVLTLPVIAGAEDLTPGTAVSTPPKPHPKEFMHGFMATVKRRGTRLLHDPLIVFFPIVHPLRASLYAEQHGYSAAAGLGTTGAAWVAALKK